ncbi:hypothetical protein [Clostridium botulinum]|nr:hypothetical protein [Clostridium botulinum]
MKIEVNVTVENMYEAKEIAHDLHKILNDNGITNSTNVTDEVSY